MIDALPTTALPLDFWRESLGLNPWHFWGLSNRDVPNLLQENLRTCDSLTRQYAWQGADAASRSDVVSAIADAEAQIAAYLGYWPGTHYTEHTVPWPIYPDKRFDRVAPVDAIGRRLSVMIPEGRVQALGAETITLIATATVGGGTLAYSDADGDGLIDTATVTIAAPAGLDTSTVTLYVAAADRIGGADRSERWRIRPTRASISAGVLTVVARAWTCVRPILYEGVPTATTGGGGNSGYDPNTATIYCQSLEVCTRVCDPNGETAATAQAVLEWDTRPAYLGGWCDTTAAFPGTNATDPASVARVVARAGVRNAELGIVLPAAAVRNATSGEWAETLPTWWAPDRVIVRGRFGAGTPDHLPPDLARAVVMLAAAVLARPICACADVNRQLYWYQFDLTLAGRQDELYSTRDRDLDNPFGTRRGAVMAWKAVKRLQDDVALRF